MEGNPIHEGMTRAQVRAEFVKLHKRGMHAANDVIETLDMMAGPDTLVFEFEVIDVFRARFREVLGETSDD